MATIADKTALEDERPMEQNQIIPVGPAKATVDQSTLLLLGNEAIRLVVTCQ